MTTYLDDKNANKKKLFKEIILFALPIMATSVLQILYNAADTIIVGKFDSYQAMAAVGSVSSIVNIVTTFFGCLSVGVLSVTARAIGQKDRDFSFKVVHTSIALGIMGGVFFGALGFFISGPMLVLMETPSTIFSMANTYLKLYFLGVPFTMLYGFASSLLKANGDTKRPLVILAISGLVNVILNCIFVICFDLGVVGVAVATVISQMISTVAVMVLLCKEKEYTKFFVKKIKIHIDALKEILRIGVPVGLQSLSFTLASSIMQRYVNLFGDIVIAGKVAATSIESFLIVIMSAIGQTTLVFTSKSFGEKDLDKIKLIFKQTLLFGIIVSFLMCLIILSLSKQFLSLYNDNPDVIEAGKLYLLFLAPCYLLVAITEPCSNSVRGMGYSTLPMVTTLIGICGVRTLWLIIGFLIIQNIYILYAAFPISCVVTAVIHFISYLCIKEKVKNRFEKEE